MAESPDYGGDDGSDQDESSDDEKTKLWFVKSKKENSESDQEDVLVVPYITSTADEEETPEGAQAPVQIKNEHDDVSIEKKTNAGGAEEPTLGHETVHQEVLVGGKNITNNREMSHQRSKHPATTHDQRAGIKDLAGFVQDGEGKKVKEFKREHKGNTMRPRMGDKKNHSGVVKGHGKGIHTDNLKGFRKGSTFKGHGKGPRKRDGQECRNVAAKIRLLDGRIARATEKKSEMQDEVRLCVLEIEKIQRKIKKNANETRKVDYEIRRLLQNA